MLVPDAKLLRTLLARYAEARIADAEGSSEATLRALDDVTYTLCVSTGTHTVADAIAAADAILETARGAGPREPAVAETAETAETAEKAKNAETAPA